MVVLTSRGPRHSFFCRELAQHFKLDGIVVDDRYHPLDRIVSFLKNCGLNPVRILKKLSQKRKLSVFEKRDSLIEDRAFPVNGPSFPEGVPLLMSPDPNSLDATRWIRDRKPDVIAVFGTRLIKDHVLSIARLGALNLHTGLSPFYRGGQCTFWCLYEEDLEHVGVTVHHLSSKIDGGDIVYTSKPEIDEQDTVRSIECKLVWLGSRDMIRAIGEIAGGNAPRIPQVEKGKLFLSKMFTLDKRLELEKKMADGLLRKLLRVP